MEASEFDERAFFDAIARSGARALLIGRRAMIALGVPALTADYDLWIHIDDIDALNVAVKAVGLYPDRDAAAARKTGRYVLENDEHVDVLVARASPTKDTGERVAFDDVWARRHTVAYDAGVSIAVPTVEDLVREQGSAVKSVRLSPEAEKAWLEPLDPAEFERRLGEAIAELDGPEGENLRSLIRWFSKRYPTARERLQYATRKHEEWRLWAERLAAGGGPVR